MLWNKYIGYIGLFLVFWMVSCADEEVDTDPFSTFDPSGQQYFIEVTDSTVFTADDCFQAIADLGFTQADVLKVLLPPETTVKIVAITYHTLDTSGNPIVASGVISYPIKNPFQSIVLYQHYSLSKNSEAPSVCLKMAELGFSLLGHVMMIVPDLIGFGATVSLPHPYLHVQSTGQVSVDMYLAAREYMYRIGKSIEKPVHVLGYSYGGSAALCFQKFAENGFEDQIIIKGTLAGGGTYDPYATLHAVNAMERLSYSCSIPYTILGMDAGDRLNLDYTKIFKEPLLSSYAELYYSKKYSAAYLNNAVGSYLNDFMHDDFFTEAKNTEFQKLETALQNNNLTTSWVPKAPITLVHSSIDDIVPYVNATNAYNAFLEHGCNVKLITYDETTHQSSAIPFFLEAFSFLYQ